MTGRVALGVRPGSAAAWLLAARPRTLGASLSPVAIGAGLAGGQGTWSPRVTLLCGVVAAGLQTAANLANDWADWRSGVDANRIGPVRVCASGLLRPAAVATVAVGLAAVACPAGIVAFATSSGGLSSWWMTAVLLPLIAFGYSAGPVPLSRVGLGEITAFVFFGPVPVLGTLALQGGTFDPAALLLGAGQGAFAATLLGVNNLRDVETDAAAGKTTIVVTLGPRTVSAGLAVVFAWALASPALTALAGWTGVWTVLCLAAAPLSVTAFRVLAAGATGAAAGGALLSVARTQVIATLLTLPGLVT